MSNILGTGGITEMVESISDLGGDVRWTLPPNLSVSRPVIVQSAERRSGGASERWAVCCCSGLEVECVNNPVLRWAPAWWLISRCFQLITHKQTHINTQKKTFPFYKYADWQPPEIWNIQLWNTQYKILLMGPPRLQCSVFLCHCIHYTKWTHFNHFTEYTPHTIILILPSIPSIPTAHYI